MRHHDEMVQGMSLVGELERDLQVAKIISKVSHTLSFVTEGTKKLAPTILLSFQVRHFDDMLI